MFTGLVQATGTVLSVQPTGGATRLLLSAPDLTGRWREGDSIAVNGVCLTALPVSAPDQFAADLAQETLDRTTLGRLHTAAIVNLELPTPAGAPLGGHVVQGHVDGVAHVVSLSALGPDLETADWRLTLDLPEELVGHVVQQGSITVDGISLTIAKLGPSPSEGQVRVEIAIIPHTYRATHIQTLTPGAAVNIETDVLAKYARKQSPAGQKDWLTPGYLMANGY